MLSQLAPNPLPPTLYPQTRELEINPCPGISPLNNTGSLGDGSRGTITLSPVDDADNLSSDEDLDEGLEDIDTGISSGSDLKKTNKKHYKGRLSTTA